MEYIKTQLQLQSKARGPPPFTGVLSGLSYTVKLTTLHYPAHGPKFISLIYIGAHHWFPVAVQRFGHHTGRYDRGPPRSPFWPFLTFLFDSRQVFSMPKAGIRFGGNAYFKQLLADEKGKLTMAKQFVAGLGAGATGRPPEPNLLSLLVPCMYVWLDAMWSLVITFCIE